MPLDRKPQCFQDDSYSCHSLCSRWSHLNDESTVVGLRTEIFVSGYLQVVRRHGKAPRPHHRSVYCEGIRLADIRISLWYVQIDSKKKKKKIESRPCVQVDEKRYERVKLKFHIVVTSAVYGEQRHSRAAVPRTRSVCDLYYNAFKFSCWLLLRGGIVQRVPCTAAIF
jgi:hypothetical protein